MGPDDPGAPRHKILEFCEKLVALLLDPQGRIKDKVVFFVGAGCSLEYGIPTTYDLAKRYLLSDKGGLSEEEKAELEKQDPSEVFSLFLKKFRDENTINIEYSFFLDIVEEARRKYASRALTYEMLVDLWLKGYVDLIITT